VDLGREEVLEKAALADRIELRLGPAIETLRALPDEELFDLAFIDADKDGYLGYCARSSRGYAPAV